MFLYCIFLGVPKLIEYVLKVVWNTVFLFYALISSGRFNTLLVQNPPSIPTLFVCWLYCRLFGAKLIVDWHNYAYTILALTLGPRAPLVRVSKVFEKYFGRMADHNLCVTAEMKKDLKVRWNIE